MKYEGERETENKWWRKGGWRERGEGSAGYGYIMSQWREQLRMLFVTGGECLEAGVFITVFTRCAINVPALVCVCVSLISVLSFNMFAHLTMNRYLLDPIVTLSIWLCSYSHLVFLLFFLLFSQPALAHRKTKLCSSAPRLFWRSRSNYVFPVKASGTVCAF